MPVVIREIVTEVVIRGPDEPPAGGLPAAAPAASGEDIEGLREALVRQAVARVLEVLRREWER